MAFKVDDGSSAIFRQTFKNKRNAVKPSYTNANSKPQINASVSAKRDQPNDQADVLRQKPKAPFKKTAVQSTPSITALEALQKANEIIYRNGGGENLRTDCVGRKLAELAVINPADAWNVTRVIFGGDINKRGKVEIKESDKSAVALSFTKVLRDLDIALIARDECGKNILDCMQRHLFCCKLCREKRAAADRLQNQLGKCRVFSHWYQGIDPNSELVKTISYGTAFDIKASPEIAAAALKTSNRKTFDISSDTQAFTDQLAAHKDQNVWIQAYFAALGSDKTARLIGNAATPLGYANCEYGSLTGSEEAAELYAKNMATISEAFNSLWQNGNLSQTDMNNLVNSMQVDNFNPSIAIDVFGVVSADVQKSFVRAAISGTSDLVKASAAFVLARMSGFDQSRILGELPQDDLNEFILGAMSGQTESLDMKHYLTTGLGNEHVLLGGVENILQMANRTIIFDQQENLVGTYSPELQNRIFIAVINGLSSAQAFENFKNNPSFKDELSGLFIRRGQEILRSESFAGRFADEKFIDGVNAFFELTLFSANSGRRRGDLMQSVIETLSKDNFGKLNARAANNSLF